MQINPLTPEFYVSDVARSETFYVDVLGFKVEYRRAEESFLFLSYGQAQLMLLQDIESEHAKTGPMNYPRGQGVNFSILTKELSRIAVSLQEKHHPLRIPIRDQWHRQDAIEHGEQQLWVMDPDGYLLRFIQSLGSRPVNPD